MALTDYVIMPGSDYQALCDKIREKTGKTDVIKSGDLVTEIEEVANGGGGSDGEWVYASGDFTPTADGTYTVAHNLGVIPDIIGLNMSGGNFTSTVSKLYLVTGFALSEKLMGEDASVYGNILFQNPTSKYIMPARASAGLENFVSSSYSLCYNVTAQNITFGTNFVPLLGSRSYSWYAYAKK